MDPISPPCSLPGGRTQVEGYFYKPVETGKVPNVTSAILEKLAFSQPFPLLRSHQPTLQPARRPTLQPARRQNASRRLLLQTRRNGKSAKRHLCNPRKSSIFPTFFASSIPSAHLAASQAAHLAASQAAERKSKATSTNPLKREKSQTGLLKPF